VPNAALNRSCSMPLVMLTRSMPSGPPAQEGLADAEILVGAAAARTPATPAHDPVRAVVPRANAPRHSAQKDLLKVRALSV
jgi:hypothetical protein